MRFTAENASKDGMKRKQGMDGSVATTARTLILVLAALVGASHQPLVVSQVKEAPRPTPHHVRFREHEFTLSRQALRLVNELSRTGTMSMDIAPVFERPEVRALKSPDGECLAMYVQDAPGLGHYHFDIRVGSGVVSGSVVLNIDAHGQTASSFINSYLVGSAQPWIPRTLTAVVSGEETAP